MISLEGIGQCLYDSVRLACRGRGHLHMGDLGGEDGKDDSTLLADVVVGDGGRRGG